MLLEETIRRRWVEGGAVLIWLVLPLATISAGTSKIYHYAYPYLPPAALAGGYLSPGFCIRWLPGSSPAACAWRAGTSGSGCRV